MPFIEGRGIATQLGGELRVSDVMPLQKCISPLVELMRQAILPFGLTCIRHGPPRLRFGGRRSVGEQNGRRNQRRPDQHGMGKTHRHLPQLRGALRPK